MQAVASGAGTVTTLGLEARLQEFYRRSLELLERGRVPYLVGGAFGIYHYTGVARRTHDFDVFLRPGDYDAAAAALRAGGHRVELVFPHWLGKAYLGDEYMDLVFGGGNSEFVVDDVWFEHAEPGEVFGVEVLILPPEELLWSKAYIMERERFDGADVAHLLLATAERLDWDRVLDRFGDDYRVLLAHLVLFGFIYPGEREKIPREILQKLLARVDEETAQGGTGERVCRGTLLSRSQYLVDIGDRGYADARVKPWGPLESEHVERWTAAIGKE